MSDGSPPPWEEQFARRGRVVLHTDRLQMFGMLVLAVLMTGASTFVLDMGTGYMIAGWAGIALFGVMGIPMFGWRALTARPVTRVDARGVAVDDTRVRWDEIERVVTSKPSGAEQVVLVLTPEAARKARENQSSPGRLLNRANDRLAGGPALALPPQQVEDTDELAGWLADVHRRCTRSD
ncbi:MAG: hypothetical protein ACRDQA_19785 [Nocardioidaceae bacterium]